MAGSRRGRDSGAVAWNGFRIHYDIVWSSRIAEDDLHL
jgi:hypothetical protein